MMGFQQTDIDGLKRKELQALCKKHRIPANLTNVEMAKRLRAFVTVEENIEYRRRKKVKSCLVNGDSSESGNGDHKGMSRRSLRNKKAEDDRMGETEDLVDGSNKNVVEIDEEVVEMTENAHPEKVIRRSMRNAAHVENPKLLLKRASETEALERGKSRNMITATRTNGSEAEKDATIVAKTGLSAGENLRRSKRHAFPATNLKQEAKKRRGPNEGVAIEESSFCIKSTLEQGLPTGEKKRSESPYGHGLSIILDGGEGDTDKSLEGSSIQRSETEEPSIKAKDSLPSGVELTIPEEVPIGEKTRSESPSGVGPSIILDSVGGDTDKGLEGSIIQIRASLNVQQEEYADTNQTLIQEPFQLSVGSAYETEKAAPTLLEEIAPHEEKETMELQKMQDKSEIPKVDANSFQKEFTTKELSIVDQLTLYVPPILTENADGMVHQNLDETEVIVENNIYKREKPGKISSLESYCRIENSPMEVNPIKQRKHLEPVEPSESVELLNGPTHSESGTSPLDTAATEDYGSMSVESNKREMVEEHVGFSSSQDQAAHFSDVARLSAGAAFTNRGAFDKSELGETSEISTDTDHCTLTNHSGDIDEPEDIQIGQVLSPSEQIPEELNDVIMSGLTSGQRVKSPARLTTMQRAKPPGMQRGAFDAEKIDETDRNVDQELTWDKFVRIEKDKGVDDQLKSSERYQGSNVPDTSIINHSSMPKDGNLGDSKLDDLLGESLEANHNLGGQDVKEYSGTFSENGDCCHPDYCMQNRGTIGPSEISIPDDVHTGMMNNNKCKDGEGISSLSSAKEEPRLCSHKGEISSDITPVERTISMKKDEHSCLSNEQGEAGRPETSLLDSTQDAQEDSCHSRSGQLDSQDNAFGDQEFVDELSRCIETDLDPSELAVLLESGPKEKQETDVFIPAHRKHEVSNEHEHDREKDQIHSAENNAEFCIQNQYTIGPDILGSMEYNVADTTKFADTIVTSEGFSRSDTLIEVAELKELIESCEGTYEDAFAEQNTSIKQGTDEEKEDILSAQKNAKLDNRKFENPQCSISKDLPRLEENDAADIMTSANDQSPVIETAHNTLQHGSLLNNGEQMALLERVDTVEKSDDDAGREYKALVGKEDDEMKQEGDVAMENTELDTRVVDPHSPICYPSVESDVTFVGNLSTRVDTADGVLHSDSVNGAAMMDEIETSLARSPEINDDAGRENNESTEQEDKDGVQDLEELQSYINKLDPELAESSHTVDVYTDLGSANKSCEASIDPLYLQRFEQGLGEYTDDIHLKMKIDDLNIEDLFQKLSNPKDFPEFKECDEADTVEMSSDTLHVDWLPGAATNQGALVEHFAVEVEETTTAADAHSASQELIDSVEREYDEEKDTRDLADIPINSSLAATDQGDTLHVDWLPEAATNQGALVEHFTVKVEETTTAAVDAVSASQEMSSVAAKEGNTESTNKGEQPSVLASGGIDKAALETPVDMVVTDDKLISETIKEFDGAALDDEVVSQMCQEETEDKDKDRTILIHETPNKVQMKGDMKENMASFKQDKVGNLTTVRPAKKNRTALTKISKK